MTNIYVGNIYTYLFKKEISKNHQLKYRNDRSRKKTPNEITMKIERKIYRG